MFTYLDLSLCMYVCLSHARPSDSKPNGRILVDHFQQVSIVCPNNVCLRTSVGFLMSDGTQQKWMLDSWGQLAACYSKRYRTERARHHAVDWCHHSRSRRLVRHGQPSAWRPAARPASKTPTPHTRKASGACCQVHTTKHKLAYTLRGKPAKSASVRTVAQPTFWNAPCLRQAIPCAKAKVVPVGFFLGS